jgi:putative hydrolase of the HAD superfamily
VISNYKKYKHISFDLWLTLIKSNVNYKPKRDQLFREFFEIDCSLDRVSEIIRNYDLMCNTINETTGENFETNEIYLLILGSLGIDLKKIDINKLEEFYCETEQLFFEYKPDLIYPDINNFLKKLKNESISTNVLSNTAFIKGKTLNKILEHYELNEILSFSIYSDECGFSKPSIKIFELLHQRINEIKNVSKKEVLHVGDNPIADYKGAIEYGFESLLINK